MRDLPVVWSDAIQAHVPGAEIWVGVATSGTEVPERAIIIRDAVVAAGARLVPATAHGDEILSSVHSPELLAHLSTVHEIWVAAGYPDYPGQPNVCPYVFPTDGMLDGMPARSPVAVHARAGLFCYDTMTLVSGGTWTAARAAIDASLTAADIVASGAPVAYAICRPPGHHATRSAFGGSCYLNNAAVAAAALRTSGFGKVAIIDIDAHHGNGTQSLFYDRADVFYGSVHVDPGAGWFPHYLGFADETGRIGGTGCNRNVPVAPGSGDDTWLAGLTEVCAEAARFGADAVVVSLGVDAAADDPESPLKVTFDGYRRSGALIHDLGRPIVAVHEGGYHLPTLGSLTVSTLTGLSGSTG